MRQWPPGLVLSEAPLPPNHNTAPCPWQPRYRCGDWALHRIAMRIHRPRPGASHRDDWHRVSHQKLVQNQ